MLIKVYAGCDARTGLAGLASVERLILHYTIATAIAAPADLA